MAQTDHNLLLSATPQLLRRAMMSMTVALVVITGTVLTTPVQAWALQTSPSALSFTGTQGAADPSAQSVTIWKGGSREKSWTAGGSASWLTVSPMSGTISTERDQISVGVNLSNLAPGNYSSSVIISVVDLNGSIRKTALPVSLTVRPPNSTSSFIVSPPSLAFTAAVGSPIQSASVTIANTGTTSLSITWSEGISWLTDVQPGTAQTIAAGQSGTFSTTVSFTGLAAGTYTGAVTIAGGGITKQVPVTLTLAAISSTPNIGLSPNSLAFSGTVGGANPVAKTFAVSNTGSGTLSWAANDNAAWLSVSPASGTNNGTVSTSVNLTGLAAGSYTAIITVSAPDTTTKTIPVTLTVSPATSPTGYTVSPPSMSYAGTVGGPNVVAGVTIANTGSTALTVTWQDTINWLIATSGDTVLIAPGGTATITHTASMNGLAAGTYSGIATLSGGGITKQVPVTLTLTAATLAPAIGLNTTSLGFAGTVGGTNPSAQTIAISNVGGGTLSWAAGDNAAWLNLSPTSGTNAGTVTASVNLAGLLSGSYTATVTVTATGATAKTIPVTLALTASTSNGTIGPLPTNLAFAGTVGGTNPAAQSFALTNTGGGTLSWTVSDNAAWLQLNSVSGTTTTETDTLSASVTTSGLAAGTYNAIITVTASGSTNSPQQIPVSLTLSATVADTASLTWNANSDTDLAGYKVYRGTASGTYGAPLATLPKTTTSYIATGLQTGTTYFFVITAHDSAGNESTFSNEVSKSIF